MVATADSMGVGTMRMWALALAVVVWVVPTMVVVVDAGAQSARPTVDGTWRATLTAPDGNQFRFVFSFHAKDRIVTGTIAVNDGPAVPIRDGRIRGADSDTLTFVRVSVDDPDDRLLFAGKVTNEAIRFGVTRVQLPDHTNTVNFTATRTGP